MRDAFISALCELAEVDERIILLTADLGFGALNPYIEQFPDRFINVGVAEQNMTTIACGLALEGRKVFTYSIANFPTLRCLEQVRNDICYMNADVTIVAVGGGFSYGQLGMSHFATEDLAILRSLPNMRVVAPTNPSEAKTLTKRIASQDGPAYLRIDKSSAGLLPGAENDIQIGKARRHREGDAITLMATGGILGEALLAAKHLAETGIQARVVAFHTLKPIDEEEIIAAARETGGIVTIEEHSIIGGLAGVVAETLAVNGVAPRTFRRIGLKDVYPTVVGDAGFLRSTYGMDAAAIQSAVTEAIGG